MEHEKRFNKKIFAMLIEKARGDRSIRQFAADCGISYVQMRKLHLGMQENPPGKKLVNKLAENSSCGIEYEDYAFAAGISEKPEPKSDFDGKILRAMQKFSNLSANQKKTVEEFIDFLLR